MTHNLFKPRITPLVLLGALLVTTAIYWPGLYGSWLFDDYPNIVDNHGVQPGDASVPSLVRAALSSPASEFKRPLASLSFAANYLATGLDPFWWKLTNLLIHLLNGLLVFWLARALLRITGHVDAHRTSASAVTEATSKVGDQAHARAGMIAALIAGAWMLLPINVTGVLYVVQRMESMANAFVLLGLMGYTVGRQRMLAAEQSCASAAQPTANGNTGQSWLARQRGFILCAISMTVPTAAGLLAKETAVMLPLYALAIEWALFRFARTAPITFSAAPDAVSAPRRDARVIGLFAMVLALPMAIGLLWLVPHVLQPATWATRDFTLGTRLLSEARIVADYIAWTLLPTPDDLSFYHDDFAISTGLLAPWTTLASIVCLLALALCAVWMRARRPLVALGLALFLGCHLLTATILPLELIYEHRNYFASFGLLLALVPLLAAPGRTADKPVANDALPLARPRYVLLAGLLVCWAALTALTAYAWGSPLRLAQDLALRAPLSPRAQYELGRTYIMYSHYDPASPYTSLVYAPLERAATLPGSSILPEQALIFMNARMRLPLKDAWWDTMIAKLKARPAGVQDESSLGALTQCARQRQCDLPVQRMTQAFTAALAHPKPSARLLATYGDYAWNVLGDHALGLRMTAAAVQAKPDEPAYRITLIRMLASQGRKTEAVAALKQLETLNFGGRLDSALDDLRQRLAMPRPGR